MEPSSHFAVIRCPSRFASHPPNLCKTSREGSTSPKPNSNTFSPRSCCVLFTLPHASPTSHVSNPLLNAALPVVSQQQSVITPHKTTLSTSISLNLSSRFVLMNASYVFFSTISGFPASSH